MTRYHPILVALHWLMVPMILLALIAGSVMLDALPNSDPQKVQGLMGHMTMGMLLGVLLILRLATRSMTAKPPHASTGNAILDKVGVWTHWIFYLLIAGMVLSGLATALGAGLFPIVFGGSGDPLPATFDNLPQRAAHGIISSLLIGLIALHVGAALYHQFMLKDGLLKRMWFGKRT